MYEKEGAGKPRDQGSYALSTLPPKVATASWGSGPDAMGHWTQMLSGEWLGSVEQRLAEKQNVPSYGPPSAPTFARERGKSPNTLFLAILLRYNSPTVKFTHLKYTTHRPLVYTQSHSCHSPLRTFPSPLKETLHPLAATP